MIVAVAEGGVIGRNGRLPWHVPEDLRHFKRTTMGHVLVMGRRTFEGLPGVLPGRPHVVVSRTLRRAPRNVHLVSSLEAAFEKARELGDPSPFVVGGAAIYRAAYPHVERIVLTRLHMTVEGDTVLPPIPTAFELVETTPLGDRASVEVYVRGRRGLA
ncbi:MAG: dihydrofolate reductase [Deltaproteobacteria bacterium]|nr:MAG: dihydrofolate reductase [Deltaproteobacteria bacterium]